MSMSVADAPWVPAQMSLEDLHAAAVEAAGVGNRGRLALAQALWAIDRSGRVQTFGFPSMAAYAAHHFRMSRTMTYDLIKVAGRVAALPLVTELYRSGSIGWCLLKGVVEVATAQTEKEWIELLEKQTPARVKAELKVAREKKRESPRKDSFGLPNVKREVRLRFTADQWAKLEGLIETIGADMAESRGGEAVAREDVLLQVFSIAREALCSDGAKKARQRAGTTVVYNTCPECRKTGVHTADGVIEVDADVIEQVTRSEGTEEIHVDVPTPPEMRRKVLGREGHRCANPHCRRTAVHAHHIKLRSRGGPTTVQNLVAVCAWCHSMIHEGFLAVEGEADDLVWTPRVCRPTFGLGKSRERP